MAEVRINKVVLSVGETQGTIGLAAPGCDPVFSVVDLSVAEGTVDPIQQVLERLPQVIAEALTRWTTQATNPTYQRPAPPPVTPTAESTAATPTRGSQTPARRRPIQQSLI
jgi:hypothetical protein